jgi:hypothetical protein
MVTLLSHTSHALEPLDVTCYNLSKLLLQQKETQEWVNA